MTTASDTLPKISEKALDALFREGRTANTFSSEPVAAQTLREIYDIAKYGPTAMNTQPLRIVYLTNDESKARLLPFMAEGNREKTGSAPVVAILAADADFHEHLPRTFPHFPGAKDAVGALDQRTEFAKTGAWLQAGYFITTVRAFGLAAGPMNGFDSTAADAEFFAGTNIKSFAVVNIGHPGENAWFDRLPRLDFEEAVTVY